MDNIDVLLACGVQGSGGDANVMYLSGFNPGSEFKFHNPATENGEPYVVLAGFARDNDPFLITNMQDAWYVENSDCWIAERRYYGYESAAAGYSESKHAPLLPSPVASLVKALDERDLMNGTIGADMSHLTVGLLEEMRHVIPKARFVDATQLFARLRAVKSSTELKYLRKAVGASEKCIRTAFELIEEKTAERAVTETVLQMARVLGLKAPWIQIGWSKVNTGSPAPDHRFERGDAGRIDTGGEFGGYSSDLARIGSIGRPSEEIMDGYRAAAEVSEDLRNAVSPEKQCSELCKLAHNSMRKHGSRLSSESVGHGVGLDLHEPPYLINNSRTILEEGMVLTCEPILHKNGKFHFFVEDMVVVTKNGCEPLSTIDRGIFVI
ncbi:MAG: Xaa-Pro peptidase family protein [Nitrososphaerales archaeon]